MRFRGRPGRSSQRRSAKRSIRIARCRWPMSACGHQPRRGCYGADLDDFDGLCETWRGVYPDFVRKKGRYGKGKALALLAALGLGAGLLSAAVALPALTPAGIATKD